MAYEDTGAYGKDLFPESKDEYDALVKWTEEARSAAHAARRPFEDRWQKHYRLYNSWVKKDAKDWRSRVFMPEVFNSIETILPRLVAQLPKFLVQPVGPEDVPTAKVMEFLIDHAQQETDLYLHLFDCFKESLIYGTGILKTCYDERKGMKTEPEMLFETRTDTVSQPIPDPDTGLPLVDADGNEVIDEQEVTIEVPAGMEMVPKEFVKYEGPAAYAVDIFDFWVAPESKDVQSARYVIHRTPLPVKEFKKRIAEGIYQWPDEFVDERESDSFDDEAQQERLDSIGLGRPSDSSRKDIELEEFWTNDNRLIVVANKKVVVRVQENAYWHRQKPFLRFTDYRMPHEFWGRGEVDAIEGLQDMINAISNQRIDEVRLKLNKPFGVNLAHLVDQRDLQLKPGGAIRIQGDLRPDEVLKEIQFGDVNVSAFTEVDNLQRMIERVTGASAYQQGTDSPSMTDTATGIAIIQEQGASRFGMKSRLFELGPLKELAMHFGSIIQQFTSSEKVLRILGPDGQYLFEQIDPMSLQGALDYSIETASIQQSETVKREQAMGLLQTLTAYAQPMLDPQTGQPTTIVPIAGLRAAIEDILEAFGKKDISRYLGSEQEQAMDPMQMALGMGQGMGGEPPPPEIPSSSGEVPTETMPTNQTMSQ